MNMPTPDREPIRSVFDDMQLDPAKVLELARASATTAMTSTASVPAGDEDSPAGDPESLFGAVTRLAGLHPLEYEKLRETQARALGVRVAVLDKEVGIARKARQEEGGKAVMFPTITAWNETVDADKLLKEIHKTIKQFIICESEAAITATLWIAFTWFVDVVEVAPLAVITAPEKRCGKTQLLNLIGRLSRRPLMAANISPAATFRVIEAHCPTLLIDEADSFLKDNEELRGVINSGHTRQSAYVIRTVGDDHTPQQFSTWGAKAISGIGHLAETLMDRAVILELRRKLPRESVQRLRHAERGLFDRLASQLARFAQDASPGIGRARPSLPDSLNDRAQDNWEPLLAIADYAGSDWPRIARDAALKLSGAAQEAKSLSAELLADIQEILKKRTGDRISTAELIQALIDDELKPWATYNKGKPISPRQLSKRLGDYGIKSQTVREGHDTCKGFMRNGFDDVFARYLPPPPSQSDLSVTTAQTGAKLASARVPSVPDDEPCDGTEHLSDTPKPLAPEDCDAVTDRFPLPAAEMIEVEF
jgi:putative DNA primase/helicase